MQLGYKLFVYYKYCQDWLSTKPKFMLFQLLLPITNLSILFFFYFSHLMFLSELIFFAFNTFFPFVVRYDFFHSPKNSNLAQCSFIRSFLHSFHFPYHDSSKENLWLLVLN